MLSHPRVYVFQYLAVPPRLFSPLLELCFGVVADARTTLYTIGVACSRNDCSVGFVFFVATASFTCCSKSYVLHCLVFAESEAADVLFIKQNMKNLQSIVG